MTHNGRTVWAGCKPDQLSTRTNIGSLLKPYVRSSKLNLVRGVHVSKLENKIMTFIHQPTEFEKQKNDKDFIERLKSFCKNQLEEKPKKMSNKDRIDYISFLHKQNLNGRETEEMLWEAGIEAGIIETEEFMLEFINSLFVPFTEEEIQERYNKFKANTE